MYNFRDLIVFLTGFEFFHTLMHIFLPYIVKLPLETKHLLLTANLNTFAIVINAAITVALFWWSTRLRR